MEYQNRFYNENRQDEYRQKRSFASYFVTAIISFVIGVLSSALLFSNDAEQPPTHLYNPTPQPTITQELPSLTYSPEVRATPNLDGVAPNVNTEGSFFNNPLPNIIKQVEPSVLSVVNYLKADLFGKDEIEQSTGSAFAISSDGYIITNEHVIRDADRISVITTDGTEIPALLVGADKTTDIAVLKIEPGLVPPLKLGDSSIIQKGDFILAIGDPTGRELAGSTTFGIVSEIDREVNIDGRTNAFIQHDAAVNPGNSGGPMFNMSGEVIGIISAKTVTASYDEDGNAISAEGLGFAIPISNAMVIVDQLIANGRLIRPGIGFSVAQWDETSAEYFKTPTGILIDSVIKDGPADKAGLKPNDIIVAVNGKDIGTQDEFIALIQSMHVGDVLSLKIWRSGNYIDAPLILEDLNSLGNENTEDGRADYEFFD